MSLSDAKTISVLASAEGASCSHLELPTLSVDSGDAATGSIWSLVNSQSQCRSEFSNTIFMKLVMSISIFGLSYHAMNGIRHIFWDFGFFLNNLSALISGIIVIFLAFGLSILLILKFGIIS